jgi:type IV secretory pathway TraG/TraD family ATPase VirD4
MAPLRLIAQRDMRPEKREVLADRIMRELAVWLTPPIADLIDRSDWAPADLRRRATLYLCVDRHDLDRYAVVLRTIIGQTIAALSRDKAMTPGASVTLFLNQAARLGPMGTISRAVDTGAEIGLRPWLFFANGGEIRTIYPNAEGMIANCAAHCYIEPDPENAQELAMRLGFVKSLFGTDEKPMVAMDELAGPDFADKIVALVRGQAPAKLMSQSDAKVGQRRGR